MGAAAGAARFITPSVTPCASSFFFLRLHSIMPSDKTIYACACAFVVGCAAIAFSHKEHGCNVKDGIKAGMEELREGMTGAARELRLGASEAAAQLHAATP